MFAKLARVLVWYELCHPNLICRFNKQWSDLNSLARWIATSKMQANVEKSHVMWFSVKSFKSPTTVLPILLEGTPLVNVSKQKYLEITIDTNLHVTWAYRVADVCKKIVYYLF